MVKSQKMAKLAAQPLYQQVKKEVLMAIRSAEWLVDESLPSETDLARRFGVSQGTVRKALDALVQEEILYRRQGVGTFVAGVRDELLSAHFISPTGYSTASLSTEFIACVRINAGEILAEMLGLRRGAALWQLRRLLRAEGEVVGVEEVLLPEVMFHDLDVRRLRESKGNFRELVWSDFGIRLTDDAARYRAVRAAAAEVRTLQVEINEPILQISRLSRDFEGQAMAWSVAWIKTEHQSFSPEKN